MSQVIFRKASYDYQTLKQTIFEILDSIEGFEINRQASVLIKPNLLMPAKPEHAILTHPLIVKAVTEYVFEKGGRPLISDSPAMGSLEKIKAQGGYNKALSSFDVEFKAFDTSINVDIGKPFGSIEMARDALEADVVINLPKLKTHSGMLLTLGVKNLFGCIVGLKKPQWHLRSGIDREMFARLLVQIYRAINPSITLVDGIWALEGQGPGKSGKPRRLGVLVGGKNAFDMDMAICTLLGMDPEQLPTHMAAKTLGLVSRSLAINGDVEVVNDFELPVLAPLTFGPKFIQKVMRKHLLQRPEADSLRCELCGECWQYCPAKAITLCKDRIDFDYDGCIRCYCCIEICPHGALCATETLPGKMLRKLSILK
ncbi:MAG: DUF362 domain-containing protein [Desulfobacterales bacterium]|nr:MAG: DUF362 domain-containing protein [Desulfobacterales bacterium]UCD89477.1 MAG: DUF362 domain-containing protein [Desulfobacterales bacterium]